ncbi:MAG: tripartite tricarboxylate transporter substrate binding protein [Burkholderiales bacterium]|nr:tripartite tricarboxylate transporter substrate binding protein [Burkholderiales bacterium]
MKIAALALAAVFTSLAGPVVLAQGTYPDRPIRMVVPFPPGGALDVLGRQVADRMAKNMNAQFVIENRPGATGHVGGEAVAKAAADGYTMLFGASSTHAVSPNILKDLKYNPIEDFTPISLAATVHNVLVVHPSVPANNVREFIDYARANPGKLSFGSSGIGSNLHLAGELLKLLGKFDMVHVPYSSPQVIPDLLSGRIQVMVDNLPPVIQHIRAGKLKAIGVASPDPIPDLPGLPMVSETVPGFAVIAWGVMLAPKGTPRPIIARLNEEMKKAIESAEVREAFARLGFIPAWRTPEATLDFMRNESAKWKRVVNEANIKVE